MHLKKSTKNQLKMVQSNEGIIAARGENVYQGLLLGAVTGTISGTIGLGTNNLSETNQFIVKSFYGGITGGIVSEAMGGKFEDGFLNGITTSAISFWAQELTNYVYKDGAEQAEEIYKLTDEEKKLLKYTLSEEYKKGKVDPEMLQKLQELHVKLYPDDNSLTSILSRFRNWDTNDLRFDNKVHIMNKPGDVNFHYDLFDLTINPFLHLFVDELIINQIIGGNGVQTIRY